MLNFHRDGKPHFSLRIVGAALILLLFTTLIISITWHGVTAALSFKSTPTDEAIASTTATEQAQQPEQLAFTSSGDICLINVDGSNFIDLTNSPELDFAPQWSPDGQQIAFFSTSDGQRSWDIFVMDADGSNVRQLTTGPDQYDYPKWSPDGAFIIFQSYRTDDENEHAFYTIESDGSNLQRLPDTPLVYGGAFSLSTDGTQLIFASNQDDPNWDIYEMDIDGSNFHRLTDDPGRDLNPTWSPDGTQIAFASSRTGTQELFIMDADGTNVRQITDGYFSVQYLSWSQDGQQIAFESNRGSRDAIINTGFDIYIVNIDGTNVRQLTDVGGIDDIQPSWRPDVTALN